MVDAHRPEGRWKRGRKRVSGEHQVSRNKGRKATHAPPMHGGGGSEDSRRPGHPSRGRRQAFSAPRDQEHRLLAAGWPGQEADSGLAGTGDRNWRIWGAGRSPGCPGLLAKRVGGFGKAGECRAMTPLPCHALAGSTAPLSPPHGPRTRVSRGRTRRWAQPTTARRGPS